MPSSLEPPGMRIEEIIDEVNRNIIPANETEYEVTSDVEMDSEFNRYAIPLQADNSPLVMNDTQRDTKGGVDLEIENAKRKAFEAMEQERQEQETIEREVMEAEAKKREEREKKTEEREAKRREEHQFRRVHFPDYKSVPQNWSTWLPVTTRAAENIPIPLATCHPGTIYGRTYK
jgi:hypothetical protein